MTLLETLWALLMRKRRGGMFDWVPDWMVGGVNIAWVMLIAFVFIYSAGLIWDPCQFNVFGWFGLNFGNVQNCS